MTPSRDQIVEAVQAFVNAQTWAESKQIVENHQDLLFTEAADEVLAALLPQYRENEEATLFLEEHRTLLLRCCREGIDAAFADLVAPRDPSSAAPGPLVETVLAFINAPTQAESKRIVENHPNLLLTEAADEVLVNLLEQYEDDEDATRQLEDRRRLLLRCRREGIDAAFADRLHPPAALEAVQAFITAGTWAESKQIVKAHSELLLTDAADTVLAELLTQYGDDEDATRTLEEHRALLLRCRREGIEAAFASLAARMNSPAAAQEAFSEIVRAFVESQSLAEKKQIVEAHRDVLLTDIFSAFLADWLAQYTEDEDFTRVLESHRALLIRCRREGIEAAFANLVARTEPPDVPKSLVETVPAFVNAQNWAESKQIVEAHRDVLLTDAADEVLIALLAQNRGNENATRRLQAHRTLLARCRREGIEAAFSNLVARTNRPAPVPQSLAEVVLAFVNAQSWADSKRIVETNRDVLLTDATDEVLAMLLEQNKDNEDAIRQLEEHRTLLARCRQEGIDAAFDDHLGPPTEAHESGVGTLLEELGRLTKSSDMPRAIAMCQAALELITRAGKPKLWAALQVQLGNSLYQNPLGDRAENLEKAIHHFNQALARIIHGVG